MKNLIKKFLTEKRPKDIQINELAAFFCEEKDILYFQLSSIEEKDTIENFCKEFGLKLIFMKEGKNFKNKKVYDFLIGKNINKMIEAKKLFLNNKVLEWGEYLGYPRCCVEKFKEWNKLSQSSKRYITLIEFIVNSTNQSKNLLNNPIKFYMNNITNFYSRKLCAIKSLTKNANKYQNINRNIICKGIDLEGFIIWHPCSYFCKESYKKAKKIADFMKEYIPEIYYIRKIIHSKPVVFKNDFEFVLLDGKAVKENNGIVINYKGIYPFPKTLISKKDLNLIKKFNQIVIKNDNRIYPKELSKFIVLPFGD